MTTNYNLTPQHTASPGSLFSKFRLPAILLTLLLMVGSFVGYGQKIEKNGNTVSVTAVNSQSSTFTSSGTYNVPLGVTYVTVKAWGGGGGGGHRNDAVAADRGGAGGGGGGGFVTGTITGLTSIPYVVGGGGAGATTLGTAGANGGVSSVMAFFAFGGSGGGSPTIANTGGLGGVGGSNTGGTGFIGGNGANGGASVGGGGGSGAGDAQNGNNATNGATAGAAATSSNGGAGGAGGPATGGGNSGLNYGGGGGGVGDQANPSAAIPEIGGNGGSGAVILSFTCPAYAFSTVSSPSICIGGYATIDITSLLLPGTYAITYTVAGTPYSDNITIASGGIGSFTIPASALATSGTKSCVITSIGSGDCVSIDANNFTVIVNPYPTLGSLSTLPVCEGTASTISANGLLPGTSGTAKYTYPGLMTPIEVSGSVNGMGETSFTTAILPLTANNLVVSVISVKTAEGCETTFTPGVKTVTLLVNENLPASVTIASTDIDNSICPGESVTFTATPTNGGASPTYIWKKGGSIIPMEVGASYTTTGLANGDVISVEMTSNATCATGSPVNSTGITTTVKSPPSGLTYTTATNSYIEQSAITPNTVSVSGTTPISYTVNSLPPGLTINASSGEITGTPTAPTTANNYIVTATNSCGNTTKSLSITIDALPSMAGDCNLLNETFSTNPLLANTSQNGRWSPDRYRPAQFVADGGALKIVIDANDGAQLRPSAYSGAFYNTQGRQIPQCNKCSASAKAKLYIPTEWKTNKRRSDLWATAFDGSDAVSFYPIIGFRNTTGLNPQMSIWDNSAWVELGAPADGYDKWYDLEVKIDGIYIKYYINGILKGTYPSEGSAYFGNIIMQAYNFNDNTLGASYDGSSNNSYTAKWDDVITAGANGNLVTNQANSKTYCSLQAAIDDPSTQAGNTLLLAPGTYTGNVQVTKAVTIKTATGSSSSRIAATSPCDVTPGATIAGAGGAAITVLVDGVTIDGIKITNPSGNFGVYTQKNNLTVKNCLITDIGNATTGSGATYGVSFDLTSNAIATAKVENNCINNLRGGADGMLSGAAAKANNGSAVAIGAGFSNAGSDITGLLINGNHITNITAPNMPFADGGKGAYGVLINVGASGSAAGKAVSPIVSNNTISGLSGLWAHGIGLEGETPGADVKNNLISGLTDNKSGSTLADKDAIGILVEDNDGAATVKINKNSITGADLAIRNKTSITGVDATCNWYGTANANTITNDLTAGPLTTSTYLITGDNDAAGTGFVPGPTATCTGSPVVITSATPTSTTCIVPNGGAIAVVFTGGTTPFSTSWTGPTTSGSPITGDSPVNITGLTAGTYDITITDSFGSTTTAQVIITNLPVTNTTQSTSYATIQAAIDAASANDVIKVCSGNYTETIAFNKAVKLQGANVGVVGTGGRTPESVLLNSTVMVSTSGPAELDGFKIMQTGPATNTNVVQVGGGSDVKIVNNIFERNGGPVSAGAIRALAISAGPAAKIVSNNLFTGSIATGLFSGSSSWNNAIYTDGSLASVTISNNTISNSRSGLNSDDNLNYSTIVGNTFNNNGSHISIGSSVPASMVGPVTLGANDFINNPASTIINLSAVDPSFRFNMTSSTLNGIALSSLTNPELFDVEARMSHKEYVAGKFGKVIYKVGNQYVNNFTSPVTRINIIQNSIKYFDSGEVINLEDGTYNQNVVFDKNGITLQGITTSKGDFILDGTSLASNNGITINNNITGSVIKNLTVKNYAGSGGNTNAGIKGLLSNSNTSIDNVEVKDNTNASGIFFAGGSTIDGVSVTNSMVSGHLGLPGVPARGIAIWDGLKTNITFTGNTVVNNVCCGIELQDGNASKVNISGNIIDIQTGDNAIGLVGLNPSVGPNLINNNTITGGGRFGIEIKNPAGGVTVSGNNVSLTSPNSDVRDRAGIAVFRRGIMSGNVDVPNGVTITSNTVAGYVQSTTSEGFGIVIEGTNHVVTGNTLNNNEVGILQQQNPSNYPGDADQSNLPDLFFGRGNSPMTCGNIVSPNTFNSNGLNSRNIGVGGGFVTNTNTMEVFCTIQAAIDDAQTLNGHTLSVPAGTYAENVIVTKEVTILGPNASINPNDLMTPRVAEAIVTTAVKDIAGATAYSIIDIKAANVTIKGLTIDGDNTNLTSGFTSTNGADIDIATGITRNVTTGGNTIVTNNIIKNLSYFGVELYDYPAGVPASGSIISNNKIMDLGTYDAGSGIALWGGGVLLYNNQYAQVKNNTITNARIGIQTGNFHLPNPGASVFAEISNNIIEARRRGIFHNLYYGTASAFTVNANTITAKANANETTNWLGLSIGSGSTPATISNNIVNGTGLTIPSYGIDSWNTQTAPIISGGTVSNVSYGINVNNFEGYASNANDPTIAIIDGVSITNATEAGVRVNDNILNTNSATVSAEIKGNTSITNSKIAVLVSGTGASANVHDNLSSFTTNTDGIVVDAGTATITKNNISNNTSNGVEFKNGGTGIVNFNNITGNGIGVKNSNAALPNIDAKGNWWGDASGPDDVWVGDGDNVSSFVDFCGWLIEEADATTEIADATGTPTASISYSSTSYCVDATDPTANIGSSTSGGEFTATPMGLSINSNGIIDLSMSTPGMYTVTYTVTGGGCNTSSSTAVTIYALPDATISSSSSTTLSCSNLSTTLSVPSGGTSYSWSTGATTSSISVNAAGTYSVTVTGPGGCTATDSQVINVNIDCDISVNQVAVDKCLIKKNEPAKFSFKVKNLSPSGGYTYSSGAVKVTLSLSPNSPTYLNTVMVNGSAVPTTSANFSWAMSGNVLVGTSNASLIAEEEEEVEVTVLGTAASNSPFTSTLNVQILDGSPNDISNDQSTVKISVIDPVATPTDVSCFGGNDGTITIATGSTDSFEYSKDGGSNWGSSNSFSGLVAGAYSLNVRLVSDNSCATSLGMVVINQPTQLVLTESTVPADHVNVLCNGANTGAFKVVASGGTSPYEFKIGSGMYGPSDTFTGLVAATYTVTVKDAKGCTTDIMVIITQPTDLTLTESLVDHVDVLCKGAATGAYKVIAGGGNNVSYAYIITSPLGMGNVTGASSGIFTGLVAGTYTVKVTDGNNCTEIISIMISEPATNVGGSASVTSNFNGAELSCNNSTDGTIDVAGTGGTGAYTYDITTAPSGFETNTSGDATGSYTALGAGSYTFTIKDANNCTFITTAVVIDAPEVLAVIATPPTATQTCVGSSATIALSNTGGTGSVFYDILSQTGPGTGAISSSTLTATAGAAPAATTTYVIKVTDANGCTGTTSVTITNPNILPDLSPTIPAPLNTSFSLGDEQEGYVQITNVRNSPTSAGTVTFTISKVTNFVMDFDSPTMSGTYDGETVNNADWARTDLGGSYQFVAKTGISIGCLSNIKIGFKIKTSPMAAPTGTGTMTVSVLNGTGGDNNNFNNQSVLVFSVN